MTAAHVPMTKIPAPFVQLLEHLAMCWRWGEQVDPPSLWIWDLAESQDRWLRYNFLALGFVLVLPQWLWRVIRTYLAVGRGPTQTPCWSLGFADLDLKHPSIACNGWSRVAMATTGAVDSGCLCNMEWCRRRQKRQGIGDGQLFVLW